MNPRAGKGNIKKKIPQIVENFEKQGHTTKVVYTSKESGLRKIIDSQANEYEIIVSCGGDGTLNEVVNAIMKLKEKPKLSFIPLGTTNDFANTLDMPTKELSLSENINTSKSVLCDIGSFNEKYFNYIAAFGIFTHIIKYKGAIGALIKNSFFYFVTKILSASACVIYSYLTID